MDLHAVHNCLNVTTYPITTTLFPNGLGRKTSPQWGKSRGFVNIPVIPEGCYCWNSSRLLFTTTSASPSALHYLHCIWALPLPHRLMLWPLVQYRGGMCLVLAVWSSSRELGSGRVRNTLCDCVSSASQLSGQGSLLLAERKQESEWKRQAQSWGCFFSYSQSTSSSSCCNPAIKIVFHSAFSLYITKATTEFFSPSLTCWQFSWTKKLHGDR